MDKFCLVISTCWILPDVQGTFPACWVFTSMLGKVPNMPGIYQHAGYSTSFCSIPEIDLAMPVPNYRLIVAHVADCCVMSVFVA